MEHSARATAMAGRSASGARGYLSVCAGRPCRRLLAKAREDAGHEADVVKVVVDSGAAMTRREAISMVSAAAFFFRDRLAPPRLAIGGRGARHTPDEA